MTNEEFEKMLEQKRADAAKPGYGARCAAKRKAAGTGEFKKGNPQELILS